MSLNVFNEGSVVLRLEFSIADAVRERGVIKVIGAALSAWWAQKPRTYSDVPAYLRADVGLEPADSGRYFGINPDSSQFHPPNWRPY